jgi:hypothetical protein
MGDVTMFRRLILTTLLPLLVLTAARGHLRAHVWAMASKRSPGERPCWRGGTERNRVSPSEVKSA